MRPKTRSSNLHGHPSAHLFRRPGLFEKLLVSLQKALHRLDHLDITALNQMAQTDLKSIGRVLDRVERVDFENLSTNASALIRDIRRNTAKLNGFIDDTDDTVKKMRLAKIVEGCGRPDRSIAGHDQQTGAWIDERGFRFYKSNTGPGSSGHSKCR